MNFEAVSLRHRKIVVIDGGESLSGFDFHVLDDEAVRWIKD